ncbi:MBL fold metallo-hydrolase [Vulgatibacter sp.]|uniref:MBL fold metallo-hydrolase n=1 Tax=Vulgatibacter sp. TaxID=1971226 RepID=UPI00356A9775
MALRYAILSSGSSGNCLWVQGGGVEILVDCGLSARRIGERLAAVGGDLRNVQAVVCTHGHGDHVAGAAVLARRYGLEVHGSAGTLRHIRGEPPPERLHPVGVRDRFRIGGLEIRLAPTPHDAVGSCSVVVADGETSLGVVTDLGKPTETVRKHLEGVDALVLEMNHDRQMLIDGPYPEMLKRRIAGDLGHLSNDQSAELLAQLLHPGLQQLALAHLSEHNNLPEIARDTAGEVLANAALSPNLVVAEQHRPGEPVLLRTRRKGQLGLPF